ncbi:Ribosomal protein L1/ribosomal biogenesis protein [Cryptosporidium tyzzeri]|nr:Ribosomal protein L1/ribosomal biogenesis protein [Cryptosporidium tyzzeri]
MDRFKLSNPIKAQKHLEDAVNALKELVKIKKLPEDLLFNKNSQFITLIISLSNTPEFVKSKHVRIKIPNSLYKHPGNEVCLFVKDPQRKWKELISSSSIEPKVVSKVIGVSKLSKKYSTYKDRRELCLGYDLFLSDDRIIEKMPKLLGSYFIKANKMPIAIKIRESNFKNSLESALSSTFMSIKKGKCIGIRVARVDMNTKQVVQNLIEAIKQVSDFFEGDGSKNWRNSIESLYIQSTNTMSLPIWFKEK